MSVRFNNESGEPPAGAAAGPTGHRLWRQDCRLEDLRALVEQPADPARYPLAVRLDHGIPTYDCPALVPSDAASAPSAGAANGALGAGDADEGASLRDAFRDELTSALVDGPGIVVLQGAVDPQAVNRATEVFWDLIAQQRAGGGPAGDHYGKPGANDRIWNALEKLALADPDAFVDYHASDAVAVACEAWLGPRYQVTEQVNVVNPGGEAQHPHRDYHMGFLTDDEAEQFPRHAHGLSPWLTLQGAIAHCDMRTDSGPTMYLPHSHKYELGYLAWRRPEFVDYFRKRYVQLALRTGDAVFFSPAIFHAAGTNRTPLQRRIANLLQISSAFGRATEAIDRTRIVNAVYPALRDRVAAGRLSGRAVANVVAASAEGYAFPTDLDQDQPVDGLAPPSQADLLHRALRELWPPERLRREMLLQNRRRRKGHSANRTLNEMLADAQAEVAAVSPADLAVVVGLAATPRSAAEPAAATGANDHGDTATQPDTALNADEEAAGATGHGSPAGSGDPHEFFGASDEPLVIDVRDFDDRERTGMIPGSVHVPLIALEWRLDLDSDHAHPAVKSHDQRLVFVCNEGFKSLLVADTARSLGFARVADLAGGIDAWVKQGYPVVAPERSRD